MFDDDDPVLRRVRTIALAFPGAAEKVSHGRPVFFTTKIFAYYGGSTKVDGVYQQHDQSVVVKPDEDEARALADEERTYPPAYLAPSGWIGIDLDGAGTDWAEIRELVEASYRMTAGRRHIAELDARVQSGPASGRAES